MVAFPFNLKLHLHVSTEKHSSMLNSSTCTTVSCSNGNDVMVTAAPVEMYDYQRSALAVLIKLDKGRRMTCTLLFLVV